jgi:hypothetical protein
MVARPEPDARPSDPEIRAALQRITASPDFRTSPKLTAFLKFVVEATLAGQADRIKGYSIAVEALGRDDSFDPQTDAIVRVEAGRLRTALTRYYAGPGRADPLVIAIPRGSYIPVFARKRIRAATLYERLQLSRSIRLRLGLLMPIVCVSALISISFQFLTLTVSSDPYVIVATLLTAGAGAFFVLTWWVMR